MHSKRKPLFYEVHAVAVQYKRAVRGRHIKFITAKVAAAEFKGRYVELSCHKLRVHWGLICLRKSCFSYRLWRIVLITFEGENRKYIK